MLMRVVSPSLCLLVAGGLSAQQPSGPVTPPHAELESTVDSGYLTNAGGAARVVFSKRLRFAATAWLQFRFGEHSNLPDGSFLRMTSKDDGGVQRHDGLTIGEWGMWSAAFNGGEVLLELVAGAYTRGNRVKIAVVIRGLSAPFDPKETICGPADNRALSNDKRNGRLWRGCTGWLAGKIAKGTRDLMLTAGHCSSSGTRILEMNVPLSNSNGSVRRAAPSDQYPYIELAGRANGIGADWLVCSVGKNSNTGKTPTQANGGVWYKLGSVPGSTAGQNITITGYGSVGSGVSRTWNAVQKTHTGPLARASSSLCYATDTSGGNSGSPVIHANTGNAIGIHTHGGCRSTGGCNSGTRIDRTGLQAAIAAAGKVVGTFTTFGAGCRGTGKAPAGCGGNNTTGGTVSRRILSNEYAYTATTAKALQVTGFSLYTSSNNSRTVTIRTAIYADVGGRPATRPLATGTMRVGPVPGFYTTTLNASIPQGTFYVAADHSARTTYLADLTSGTAGRAFWRRPAMGTGSFNSSGAVSRSSFRILCKSSGGGNAVPSMDSTGLPNINSSFRITVSQSRQNAPATLMTGASRTQWSGGVLPFPLAVIGAPGCDLLVSPSILIGARTDASGNASIQLRIPNLPSLVDAKAYHQWYVAEPTVNGLGLAVSNAGVTTVGG